MVVSAMRKQALSQLSRALGAEQAKLELTWMLRSLDHSESVTNSLSTMVARRVRGEPLQYILGR